MLRVQEGHSRKKQEALRGCAPARSCSRSSSLDRGGAMSGGTALCECPFTVCRSLHPDHLWIWRPNVFVDENDRTWLPIINETESSLQVLMRQIKVSSGEAMQPSQLPPSMLPLMWQLYPGRRYRASDSSFWRIVYHIEISGVEDMVLEQLPDP
ncbi:T-cell leukemia/lymphoma protein 1A-like isoform X2 [Myotis lucifugus]|uniref:T-cell leukemia/lymphoma protein 1A-like isoform X2 n=1 Tax=Myotis lucifugus TaxID=59463 RepID=UPI000CCC29A0|nr:T-cell leukemia/lymphoma protein 1A-like isoform X2 [Myotis lucifugus]